MITTNRWLCFSWIQYQFQLNIFLSSSTTIYFLLTFGIAVHISTTVLLFFFFGEVAEFDL